MEVKKKTGSTGASAKPEEPTGLVSEMFAPIWGPFTDC